MIGLKLLIGHLRPKPEVKSMIGHLRPSASRRLSVSRPQVSRNIFPEVRLEPGHHVTTVRPSVTTTSAPTVHNEVGRIVILERPEVAGGVWGGAATTGEDLGMDEQRSRLRRILAPKPRHHRGPVPTLTTPEVEEKKRSGWTSNGVDFGGFWLRSRGTIEVPC